jgi:predicted Zn-dependent protease
MQLAPHWPKAQYRLATALMALGEWQEAAHILQAGLKLAPGSQVQGVNSEYSVSTL